MAGTSSSSEVSGRVDYDDANTTTTSNTTNNFYGSSSVYMADDRGAYAPSHLLNTTQSESTTTCGNETTARLSDVSRRVYDFNSRLAVPLMSLTTTANSTAQNFSTEMVAGDAAGIVYVGKVLRSHRQNVMLNSENGGVVVATTMERRLTSDSLRYVNVSQLSSSHQREIQKDILKIFSSGRIIF